MPRRHRPARPPSGLRRGAGLCRPRRPGRGLRPGDGPRRPVVPARPRTPPGVSPRVVVRHRQPHRPRRRRLRRPVDALPSGHRPRARSSRLGEPPESGWATPPLPPPPPTGSPRPSPAAASARPASTARSLPRLDRRLGLDDRRPTRRPRPPPPHRRGRRLRLRPRPRHRHAARPPGRQRLQRQVDRGPGLLLLQPALLRGRPAPSPSTATDPRHRPGMARPRMVEQPLAAGPAGLGLVRPPPRHRARS